MLPFLQPRKITSILMATRTPEGSIESKPEPQMDHGLLSAAEYRSGHRAKDALGVATAMKACHELRSAADSDDAVDENREGMI